MQIRKNLTELIDRKRIMKISVRICPQDLVRSASWAMSKVHQSTRSLLPDRLAWRTYNLQMMKWRCLIFKLMLTALRISHRVTMLSLRLQGPRILVSRPTKAMESKATWQLVAAAQVEHIRTRVLEVSLQNSPCLQTIYSSSVKESVKKCSIHQRCSVRMMRFRQ